MKKIFFWKFSGILRKFRKIHRSTIAQQTGQGEV